MTAQTLLGLWLVLCLLAVIAAVIWADTKKPPRYPEQENDL